MKYIFHDNVIFQSDFSSEWWFYFSLSWEYWDKNAGLDLGIEPGPGVWWRLKIAKNIYHYMVFLIKSFGEVIRGPVLI